MNGRDLFSGLSYISKKYIDEAENETVSGKVGKFEAPRHGKTLFHKSLLIAAVIAAMLFLMGAAVYTHWSGSMQRYYQPTEKAKQQAEKSGLSVMYEESQPEDGSILSATDQGITVSVIQTLVDQSQANIILRIEGFTPTVDYKVEPWVWLEEHATLGGNEHFYSSARYDFDDGVIRNEDGEYVYADGSPVDMIVEGEYEEKFIKGQYIKHDGSLELIVSYDFQDTSGANLGKDLEIHITGFGTNTYKGKADSAFEKTVDGHWDLRFPLTGSNDNIKITPNVRLSDNVTLLDAEIGQLSIQAHYKLDAYWDGFDRLEFLEPPLYGVKMKDGSIIEFWPLLEKYEDEDNLIYTSEYRVSDGVVDMEQAESLVYSDGWETDAEGKPTVPIYKYVPIA